MDLRSHLATDRCLAAPGAADCLTARLVEKAGFGAVYMTGLGATAVRLGTPDLGLLTATEMADHARSMAMAVDIPVIADADNGYGGPLNIRRVVEDYRRAGVAALHLEDQASPKRCGQLAGIRLIEPREAELRLKAALAARGDGDLVIIGRTDALPAEGLDAAIERAKRYQGAGVDLVFVDGVKTASQVEAIAREITGPKVVSLVDGTDAARLTLDDVSEMGFSIAIYSMTALFAAAQASLDALSRLKSAGRPEGGGMSYDAFSKIVDLAGHQSFSQDFEP